MLCVVQMPTEIFQGCWLLLPVNRLEVGLFPHSPPPQSAPQLSKTLIVEKEKVVDVVCGPDAYIDLPRLLAVTNSKQAGGRTIPQHPPPICP